MERRHANFADRQNSGSEVDFDEEGNDHDLERAGIRTNGNKPWLWHFTCALLATLGAGCYSRIFTYGFRIFVNL